MKKVTRYAAIALIAALAAMLPGTLAENAALTMPDPGDFLQTEGADAGGYETGGRTFTLKTYERGADWSYGIQLWMDACVQAGYSMARQDIDGKKSYLLTREDRTVILVPQYSGSHILLMLEKGVVLTHPEAAPAPEPTARPEEKEGPCGHYAVEYAEEKSLCPNCLGTKHCPLCHGTGVYRRYGEAVDCPKECTFCGGEGYYIRIVPRYTWVPGDGC